LGDRSQGVDQGPSLSPEWLSSGGTTIYEPM